MRPDSINLNPYYLFFMVAVAEEFIFRYIPFTLYDVTGYAIIPAIAVVLYAFAHKLAFSWMMVGITTVLGFIFLIIWLILPHSGNAILPFLTTIALHYTVIILNYKVFHIN